MSEQQDKQRAIEALSAAGFKQGDVLWYRGRGDSIDMCNLQDDGLFELQLVGKHKDLAALLNHTTKEQAEEHILTQLDRWHSCNGWSRQEKVAFVMTLIAHLFPEEAPTDETPG